MRREVWSLRKQEEETPGDVCPVLPSCPLKARAVVSALEFWAEESCVAGCLICWRRKGGLQEGGMKLGLASGI